MRNVDEPLLVLGATSLIGRFLLPRLEASRTDYAPFSRQAPRTERWLQGDLDRINAAGLPRSRRVVSLSPIWLLPPALPALLSAGMQRLVAFSSTSRFTKTASPDPAERAVARRLAEAEAATSEFCEARGVRWTILRPTLIYAEGQDQNVTRLAGLIRRLGFVPLYGRGEGRRQPVHADDLAGAALAALDAPGAADRAFDLPGGETLSYRAMVERIFEGMGRRPRIVSLPAPLWRAGFALAAPLLPGAGVAMGARMAEDLVFDGEPARAALEWSPRAFRPAF